MLKPTNSSWRNEETGIVAECQQRRETFGRFIEHRVQSPLNDPVLRVQIHKMADARVKEEVDRLVRNRVAEVMESLPASELPKVTLKQILEAVSAASGYTIDELTGPRRDSPLTKARFMAMGLIRQLRTDLGLTAIGRAFKRDHTTVMHGLSRYKELSTILPLAEWLAHPAVTGLIAGAGEAVEAVGPRAPR